MKLNNLFLAVTEQMIREEAERTRYVEYIGAKVLAEHLAREAAEADISAMDSPTAQPQVTHRSRPVTRRTLTVGRGWSVEAKPGCKCAECYC